MENSLSSSHCVCVCTPCLTEFSRGQDDVEWMSGFVQQHGSGSFSYVHILFCEHITAIWCRVREVLELKTSIQLVALSFHSDSLCYDFCTRRNPRPGLLESVYIDGCTLFYLDECLIMNWAHRKIAE